MKKNNEKPLFKFCRTQNHTKPRIIVYLRQQKNMGFKECFLAPLLNKVVLGAGPNNLWTRVGAEGERKKTEHVTVIKCVLLPALWQAPKYNSERKADRRPDGIGSRYLSEINRMLFVSPRGKQPRRFLKSAATRSDRIFTHTGIRAFHARSDRNK